MVAEAVERTLASVDYLVEVRVESVGSTIPGGDVVVARVDDLAWADDVVWNLGVQERVVAPAAGDVLRLLSTGAWGVQVGDRATVGVATLVSLEDVDGSVQVAFWGDAVVSPTLPVEQLDDFFDLAEQVRPGTSREALALTAIQDGRRWIDGINTTGGREMPGLLGEVAALREAGS